MSLSSGTRLGPRRLTLGSRNRVPVWSADGERLAFQSDCEGDLRLFWRHADGMTGREVATEQWGSGSSGAAPTVR